MPSKKRKNNEKTNALTRPKDVRALERTSFEISLLLREKKFSSTDEVRRYIENLISSGQPFSFEKRTPLEKAQSLMYDAFEAEGAERVKLAREALAICPDCADAYVLLAEETAQSLQEAAALYEKGVRAGERALGKGMFKEEAGHFWSIVVTRPYMRARAGLAQCLWMMGERAQAIDHFEDLLRLDSVDHLGLRHALIHCLIEDGRDEAAVNLLDRYPEDKSATWAYSHALLHYRRSGEIKESEQSLRRALDVNPYVPFYLLGLWELPDELPTTIGLGDENEAIVYAVESWRSWEKTPGALEWLARNLMQRIQ
ncbi:MAG: tetratricopeptide repeat protein [Candidatus Aminicenantes bacterium]|nr:tetratricopeptide repeat protein [Candidatus Aminicenantes bacterium]